MTEERSTKFPIPKNELYFYDEETGSYKPLVGKSGAMPVNNAMQKIRDGFETLNPDNWDVVKGNGDIIDIGGNTQGSGYVKISKSLDVEDSETILLSKFVSDSPVRMALGMSLSQRLMHQRFSFGIVGVDGEGNIVSEVTTAPPVSVASLSQTTTTLTVTTTAPHGYVPNDRIVIYGVNDSRANYGEVFVATITSPTVFTVTASATATLPSQTIVNINNSGTVQKIDPFMGARNAFGVFWEGTSSSNAKVVSRTAGGSPFYSAETSFGSAHTDATVSNAGAYADAFNPKFLYDLRYKAEGVIVRTFPLDSISAQGAVMKRTQVIPEILTGYKIRIRAKNNKVMTKPVAKISNVSKAGSTTATVTTIEPHGLTTTDYIQIYGVRDQTGFPNITTATAVASVVDANTFTIAIGSSATVASKGGTVIKVNGTFGITPSPISVQSIAVTGGLMTVIGNNTWTGFAHSETVELRGLVDSTTGQNYTQYEKAYKVASISGTTLILHAPDEVGKPDFTAINMGGAVIRRTDLRLHLFRAIDYTRHTVELDGSIGNSTDNQEALAVNMVNFSTSMSGAVAHDGIVSGSPVRVGSKALTANLPVNASSDVADLISTREGVIITRPYSIPEAEFTYSGTAITNTTDVVLKALLASTRNYLTGIQIQNTHDTVGTEVVIKDGSTVIWRGYAPAKMQGILEVNFNIPLKTTAGVALNFACITTGANVYVNAQGYQAV